MKNIYFDFYKSIIGDIILVGNNNGLMMLDLIDKNSNFEIKKDWIKNDKCFTKAKKQLDEYFIGKRKKFDLKLNIIGTDFQKKVWNELLKIEYGEVCSYKGIATNIKNPKSSRAVGLANNKNPIAIIIPCHRVISHNGNIGGYGYGVDIKKLLLNIEKNGKNK